MEWDGIKNSWWLWLFVVKGFDCVIFVVELVWCVINVGGLVGWYDWLLVCLWFV